MIKQKLKIRPRDVEIRIRSVRFTPRGYVLKELCRNSRFLSFSSEKVAYKIQKRLNTEPQGVSLVRFESSRRPGLDFEGPEL